MKNKQIVLLLAVLVFVSVSDAASNGGLIAYYNFDEGRGDILHDASGNENHAKIYSAKWGTGKYGGALEFNGKDSYVGSGNHFLSNLDEFTVEGWVYPKNLKGLQGFFGQNDVLECGFNYNKVECYPFGGWDFTNNTFAQDKWHHIAAVGINNSGVYQFILYIDGMPVKETNSKPLKSSNDFFTIGGRVWDSSGNFFDGSIDEVKIFHRALSESEIKGEYTLGVSADIPSGVTSNAPVSSSGDSLIENFARSILGCKKGFMDCAAPQGDCETNVWTDNNNCGECGKQCPTGYFCMLGSCIENTKENKEKLIVKFGEEYTKNYQDGKYEEARYYLLRVKDTYLELGKDDKASETNDKIEDIDKKIEAKAVKEEKIKELMKIAGAIIVALAIFVYNFRKKDKQKAIEGKRELIKKIIEPIVVLVIFIILNQFLIPQYFNSKIYAAAFFGLSIGLISSMLFYKALAGPKYKPGKRIAACIIFGVAIFIISSGLGIAFLWGILGGP